MFDAQDLRLGEYLDRWLTEIVQDTVRQRTWERYEQIARVHLKPTLGRVQLKALSPTHVRGLYREKLNARLASRIVQYIHTTLLKALNDAVTDGLIPRKSPRALRYPDRRRRKYIPYPPPNYGRSSTPLAATV